MLPNSFVSEIIIHLTLTRNNVTNDVPEGQFHLVWIAYHTKQDGLEAMLYTCIWGVLGSNLSCDGSYPEAFYGFRWFLLADVRIVPPLGHNCFLLNVLQFIVCVSHRTDAA
jgi:hypothetical protein